MMKYKLVTVEGNIGAGKTTLAKMLAKEYKGKLILEGFEDNPFLPKFFEDFKQNAFATELYFMAERYQQLSQEMQEIELFQDCVIMDYLFTKSLLYAKVNLSEEEFNLFHKLFHIINPRLPEPEMIVYVHSEADRLVRNIISRGRGFEQTIQKEYLTKLQETYFNYFKQNPEQRIVVLDCTEADFVANPSDYQKILEILTLEHKPGTHFFKIV